MPIRLPARQVHLDFHTSELIPDVGARFDKLQFQEALRTGHVNAINLFAKCHHGWSYYPTSVGNPHPNLCRNLLGEEIEACHEIGVRAPIYFTIGFSVHDVETHPQWVARDRDGAILPRDYNVDARPGDRKPLYEWKFLCPSGDYLELILAQTREICDTFPVDGFWYDICGCSGACYCDNCRQGMRAAGLDSENEAHAWQYYVSTWQKVLTSCSQIIRAKHPLASTYFNGMTQFWERDFTPWMTQIELEDLPSVGGSYDKFPLAAKYYSTKGKGVVAMSGKFHTAWGEFGGFKDPEALRYEAASMISFGAACSIGDQMHPSGQMDLATYRNLGVAYRYVEQIEAYGLGGEPCANLGVWTSYSPRDDQGVASMLLENQVDFEMVGPATVDLARFAAIVLPGAPCLSDADAARLQRYVADGGSLLVLGASALDRQRTHFLLDVGAAYLGPARYEMDYTVAGPRLGAGGDDKPGFSEKPGLSSGLVSSPFLNYTAALRTRPVDAEVLATLQEPYFDRTYAHYCSHQNTPYRAEPAEHPAALQNGRIVTLLHPLGQIYYDLGARVHRDLFMNALRLVYKQPLQAVQLPSAGRANLVHQRGERRYVTHLLYAPPLKRGRCLVIEDMPPIYDIPVTLRVPQAIRRAYLVPQGEELALERDGDAVRIVVAKLRCHQAVAWEY